LTLPSGQKAAGNELNALWQLKSGVKALAANDMNASFTQYRVFKNRGDSLVVTFSQAIDTSKTFRLTGFGTVSKLTYRWSVDLKTVTVKDTSTLANVKAYTVPVDYSLTGTPQYSNLTFVLTTLAGEVQGALAPNADFSGLRPDLQIHTEVQLVAVDANFLSVHDASAMTAGDAVIDTFLPAQDITIIFNRAVDTSAVRAAVRDAYFSLFNSAVTTIPLDYAISFSIDGKTVTLNPTVDLVPANTYNVKVTGVPDLSSGNRYSGPATGNYLVTANFKVQPLTKVTSIAGLAAAIAVDTNTTAGVADNRIGASPMAAIGGVYRNALLSTETAYRFLLMESAWNAHHADSVAGYQWRVRAVSRTGVAGDWYEVSPASNITTSAWSTAWNASTLNAANAAKKAILNVAAARTLLNGLIVTYLRTNWVGRPGYSNGNNSFNDSAQIEVQVRPVKDFNADGNYTDAGEFGQWSNSVIVADNIAPCDSDFVMQANLATLAQGGVGVARAIKWDNNNPGDVAFDSAASTVTLTFPEDMDTSTVPTLTFASGTATAANYSLGVIPVDPRVALGNGAGKVTGWTSARAYTAYILMTSQEDYRSTSPGVPYIGFAINIGVDGMRDASGVTIPAWGALGATGTVDLTNGSNGQSNGSVSVMGWTR
jgi:hypothetical protein